MKLLSEENRIVIAVSELVSSARRKVSRTVTPDEDEPGAGSVAAAIGATLGITDRVLLRHDCEHERIALRIEGTADGVDGDTVTLLKSVTGTASTQKKAELAQYRGEGYILSYIRSCALGGADITLRLVTVNGQSGECSDCTERLSAGTLSVFFRKCLSAVSAYAAAELERVRDRLPSLASMKFPYPDVRAGQKIFIKHVYRAISRGGTVFSSAPTGTGKTVSVIYPALKALGEGKCAKVFYLTPKTTTQQAARDCLELMAEGGARVRALILTSKERSCPRHMICRDGAAACDISSMANMASAVKAVYEKNKTVIELSDIAGTAAEYKVCPYELELSYAELCDIIICDFNYLFDPVAYIRRFFTEGADYAFLIDEAHNLADRGREMYSAELSLCELTALLEAPELGALSRLRQTLPELKRRLADTAMSYLRDEMIRTDKGEERGAVHLSDIPPEIYNAAEELCAALEEEERAGLKSRDSERQVRLRLIRDLLYRVKKLCSALRSFDTGYRLFMFCDGGEIRLQVYCIDTGREIQRRLDKGRSAVFFSATLSPIEYYRAVLSDDRHAAALEVDSPFDPSQLSVSIMERISTRYSEREKTSPAISRVIAAAMAARRGHYMVFAPSFEYAEELYRSFSTKYPKIKCLLQTKDMSPAQRSEFIRCFSEDTGEYLLGFCVMGGIYSEGIDLAGESLIGAVVVGIGIPSISYEREAVAEYFEDKYESGKQYAYIYPGMNRVLQAAGRVIRREDDRGVIVLIDDRFCDPIYKKSIPALWEGMKYVQDAKELKARLDKFWADKP